MQGGIITSGSLGTVNMDVVVNFSDGSGALTATKLNNGTHGANWGTWHEYHQGAADAANTHSLIENHNVLFPGVIACGGQQYTGAEGQGLTFDFSSPQSEYDIFQLTLSASVTSAIALYL